MTADGALALVVGVLIVASLIISALVLVTGAWLAARREADRERTRAAAWQAEARAAWRRAMSVDALSMDYDQLAACAADLLRRAELPIDLDQLPPEEETC
ncbi:hypothetical protein ACIA8K_06870 [Catenuloplanes sp. NPDC051500]|uniref:hypothetical protein n=1 Tax=Catenuloplanes sp. NPDC051500 TaxID=3363959 RepID=UPI0037A220B9